MFELDAVPELPNGFYRFELTISRDGSIGAVVLGDATEEDWADGGWGNPGYPPGAPHISWTFNVAARDEAHARKIAGEWRAQLLASGAWDVEKFWGPGRD